MSYTVAIIGELLAAYYGQHNEHVIVRLRVMEDHGKDHYLPGDRVTA
jgi:hypothetical protein